MKKFRWDIDLLRSKKQELEKIVNLYEELLELYTTLLQEYDIKINLNEVDFDDEVELEAVSIEEFKQETINKIGKEKLNVILKAIEISKNYSVKFIEPQFEIYPLNDEELIEVTKKLFRQIPNQYFQEEFDKITNPNNQLLHIRHHKKLITDDLGLTYIDTKDHIPYGLVARHNSIQDIITLAHEITHMIIRKFEEPMFAFSSKTAYIETEGYFTNLLFSELLKKEGFNKTELTDFTSLDLQTILSIINDTFITVSGINLSDSKGQINFPKLSNHLKRYNINTPINAQNFNGFLHNDFENDINYAISYLTALDLYKIYKHDPQKAIHHLLTVPTLEGEHIQRDLEQIDVTFFEDGYSNLNEHCKKLLKQKTTKR